MLRRRRTCLDSPSIVLGIDQTFVRSSMFFHCQIVFTRTSLSLVSLTWIKNCVVWRTHSAMKQLFHVLLQPQFCGDYFVCLLSVFERDIALECLSPFPGWVQECKGKVWLWVRHPSYFARHFGKQRVKISHLGNADLMVSQKIYIAKKVDPK